MSMTTLTILQFITMFCSYSLVVIILPAIVFRSLLRGRSLSEQFLLCLVIGNFFIMNIVFVLQLLHISNTFTLILSTVVISVLVGIKVNHIDARELLLNMTKALKRMDAKELGVKTVLYRVRKYLAKLLKVLMAQFYRVFVEKAFQWLWVLVIVGAVLMIYGPQMAREYGYTASDVPVHMYWVNGMLDNDIFVAGVYPFGFHCVVYYINQVFGLDVYVIMRVIALMQNIFIVLALLGFLKGCCKSRYTPYIATLFFVAGDLFNPNTYNRYYAPLPQEYGMIFILPAIYFGFKFFKDRRDEVKAGEKKKKESMVGLAGFAMSFGMTLAVHFYGTMVAGLFCVAMAVGYIFLFVRKEYFFNIVVTCFISVAIAVLPMGIAFATGTPLQGSLGWGLSIITGTDVDVSGNKEDKETQPQTQPQTQGATESATQAQTGTQGATQSQTETQTQSTAQQETVTVPVVDIESEGVTDNTETESETASQGMAGLSFSEKVQYVLNAYKEDMQEAVLKLEYGDSYKMVLWGILAVIALGLLFMVFGKYCYGAMMVSCGIYMVLMSALLSAGDLGLPSLMDPGRCSIYYAYSVPILLALIVDAVLNLLMWAKEMAKFKNFVSLLIALLMVFGAISGDFVKAPRDLTTLEMNEAVACLTNIIREEEDFTWTICSANDETQMGKEHGYHYESIDFLKKQEYVGDLGEIIIPTHTVFIFIEKRPLDYTVYYEGSGQAVSELGAMKSLPLKRGISMYQGEARWVVMSRMYYWAQEFKRMYPEDMTVYCETADFICYRIEQNTYRLYNFAIDYGYNTN